MVDRYRIYSIVHELNEDCYEADFIDIDKQTKTIVGKGTEKFSRRKLENKVKVCRVEFLLGNSVRRVIIFGDTLKSIKFYVEFAHGIALKDAKIRKADIIDLLNR